MAGSVHHGYDGVVYADSDAVAEVKEFRHTNTSEVAKHSSKGEAAKVPFAGHKDGSGSLTCNLKRADTDGQNVLVPGASITLHLYPDSKTVSESELTGTVIIETVEVSSPESDINQLSITYQGHLAWAVIMA